MLKSSDLVTAVGGLLCHAAILSRELEIPCVVGIGARMKKIWKGSILEINGEKGSVRIV
jgi:pyruvate,water dikinase